MSTTIRIPALLAFTATTIAAMPIDLAFAQSAAGPVVRGAVIDTTGRPIAYAHIDLGRAGSRVADDSGRFTVPLRQAARVSLSVRRVGFRPFSVSLEIVSDTALLLVMRPADVTLSPVLAEAENAVQALELSGFYERLSDRERGLNSGWFITPEELERRRVTRATNLLQGIPGVRVQRRRMGTYEYNTLVGNANCPLTVYLDGMRLQPPPRTPPQLRFDKRIPAEVDEVVVPRELAGVEIYSRFPPPGFELLNGTCGVVLFWTK